MSCHIDSFNTHVFFAELQSAFPSYDLSKLKQKIHVLDTIKQISLWLDQYSSSAIHKQNSKLVQSKIYVSNTEQSSTFHPQSFGIKLNQQFKLNELKEVTLDWFKDASQLKNYPNKNLNK